jgi:hypothetical protein
MHQQFKRSSNHNRNNQKRLQGTLNLSSGKVSLRCNQMMD